MANFAEARQKMVDCQIRPNDVTGYDVLAAFSSVPRESFVSKAKDPLAYIDTDILLVSKDGSPPRFLMQVTPFAKMVEAAEIKQSDVVLCVGSGCGYGAAIISMLADSVVAIEEDEQLETQASGVLNELGFDNVAVMRSEHAKGYAKEAPFDVIFVEGSVEQVSDTLFAQLRDGGRLVVVIGAGLSSVITVFLKKGDDISAIRLGNVAVPVLPGFAVEKGFVF